jgi:hypothetical protein
MYGAKKKRYREICFPGIAQGEIFHVPAVQPQSRQTNDKPPTGTRTAGSRFALYRLKSRHQKNKNLFVYGKTRHDRNAKTNVGKDYMNIDKPSLEK